MSKNQHNPDQDDQALNQNNQMSDDPGDGHRLTDNPKATGNTPAENKPPHDRQDEAAIEEFGRDGMGVAPKE